jgi:hypothetical protein
MALELFTLTMQFAFGQACDHSSYVRIIWPPRPSQTEKPPMEKRRHAEKTKAKSLKSK